MANDQRPFHSTLNYCQTHLQPLHVFHCLYFVVGFSIGMMACFYLKSFSSSLQAIYYPASSPPPQPHPLMHNMTDIELLLRASKVPITHELPYKGQNVPKVAFMFLTQGPLPFAPLWENFCEEYQVLYSVYVHPHPSYNDPWPQRFVFYGKRIPTKPVYRGTSTVVDADRRTPCYVDEHYLPTLMNMLCPELSSNRSLTWVDWSRGGGPHPRRFGWVDMTDELINRIRHGIECHYNGNVKSMCFLFARKYLANALEPFLPIAPLLLGFDP